MFITSGNWRGKHNSLSRGAGADLEGSSVVLGLVSFRRASGHLGPTVRYISA